MRAETLTIRQPRLCHVFAIVLLVVGGMVGTVLGTVVGMYLLMLRTVQGNQDRVRQVMGLRVLRWVNDAARKSAGRRHSPLGLLTHVGRRSGRTYQTPLRPVPQGDGFVLALTYGRQVDWCQNVLAAGTCKLVYKGQIYELDRPEIVSAPEVERVWPAWGRMALLGRGIQDFLWVHETKHIAAESQQVKPLMKRGAK